VRIGLDIDGVLYPWDDCAREALAAKFGRPKLGPSLRWDWIKENTTSEEWAWLWSKEGQDACFGKTWRHYPGVREAVARMLRTHEVHFVTHRDPRRTAIHTAEFLEHHFGQHPWAGVHVIQRSTRKAALQDWDVFVDDKPETVVDFLVNSRARVFAPRRSWNADLIGHDGPRFAYYDHLSEVAEAVGS
jgi:hypothetical protein